MHANLIGGDLVAINVHRYVLFFYKMSTKIYVWFVCQWILGWLGHFLRIVGWVQRDWEEASGHPLWLGRPSNFHWFWMASVETPSAARRWERRRMGFPNRLFRIPIAPPPLSSWLQGGKEEGTDLHWRNGREEGGTAADRHLMMCH